MINAIFAVDRTFGLGHKNSLPWPKNKEDLQWFKSNTENGIVIMGKQTWESLPFKPLKNRTNVVVTHEKEPISGVDVQYSGDIKALLDEVSAYNKTVWIIGGLSLLRQSFQYCDELYLTHFIKSYVCDIRFTKEEMKRLFEQFPNCRYNKINEDVTYSILAR